MKIATFWKSYFLKIAFFSKIANFENRIFLKIVIFWKSQFFDNRNFLKIATVWKSYFFFKVGTLWKSQFFRKLQILKIAFFWKLQPICTSSPPTALWKANSSWTDPKPRPEETGIQQCYFVNLSLTGLDLHCIAHRLSNTWSSQGKEIAQKISTFWKNRNFLKIA